MAGNEYIPLTHAEKRIYLPQKLHPGSCMWNVPVSLKKNNGQPGTVT